MGERAVWKAEATWLSWLNCLLFLLKMQEVLPCILCPLIDRLIDRPSYITFYSMHRHLTHKSLSETQRAKSTVLIRFRCHFNELGLLLDKVFRPCACPVIRDATVALGLLTI